MQRTFYTADGRWLSDIVPDEVLDQSIKVALVNHPEVFKQWEPKPRAVTFVNKEKFCINVYTWDGTRAVTNEFEFKCDNKGSISLVGLKTY